MSQMSEFSDLKHQLQEFHNAIQELPEEGKIKVLEALELATKYHQGQMRKDGIEYIIHPVRVAVLLMKERQVKDKDVICAAILHDTLEDTPLDPEQIKKEFGPQVLSYVQSLTIKKDEGFEDYFEKAMKDSLQTALIKLADRLDNARSWFSIIQSEPEFVRQSLAKVEKYFLPTASRADPSGYFEKQLLYNVSEARKLLR